ncbi:MAG: hypothetical protein QOK40_2423 [Miltoncostaeaceae bacterium]|jgi:hypothetical protein|nr:hypothetical protein [Miltoncostaeaceae bacterium]
MKKLLVILGLGAAYLALKRRLGGGQEEFAFTEAPPDGLADPSPQPSAGEGH